MAGAKRIGAPECSQPGQSAVVPQGAHNRGTASLCPSHPSLEGLEDLPESARRPGGGVKVGRTKPEKLARAILKACEKRKPEIVIPGKARLLFAIAQLFPRLGDWIVLKKT